MAELQAGDYVLAFDETTGTRFADRVFTNLHLQDESDWSLLEINHTLGSLTVTPDHVLFADGAFTAARFVRLGSSMITAALGPAEQGGNATTNVTERGGNATTNVTVLNITPTSGKIINPLTHSGTILVATGDGEGAVGLFAGTVLESPHNSMLTMARMPGMCKLASYLFPQLFQASLVPEFAILLVADLSQRLPYWLGFGAFALVDVIVGAGFILWSSGALVLAGAALALRARRCVA